MKWVQGFEGYDDLSEGDEAPAVGLPVSAGGLATDPVTGSLWAGSNQSSSVFEFATDGTLIRTVDLAPQSVASNEMSSDAAATNTRSVDWIANGMWSR